MRRVNPILSILIVFVLATIISWNRIGRATCQGKVDGHGVHVSGQ